MLCVVIHSVISVHVSAHGDQRRIWLPCPVTPHFETVSWKLFPVTLLSTTPTVGDRHTHSHAKLCRQVLQIRTCVLMLTQVLSPTEPSPEPLTEVFHSLTNISPTISAPWWPSFNPTIFTRPFLKVQSSSHLCLFPFSPINYHKLNLPGWVSVPFHKG